MNDSYIYYWAARAVASLCLVVTAVLLYAAYAYDDRWLVAIFWSVLIGIYLTTFLQREHERLQRESVHLLAVA